MCVWRLCNVLLLFLFTVVNCCFVFSCRYYPRPQLRNRMVVYIGPAVSYQTSKFITTCKLPSTQSALFNAHLFVFHYRGVHGMEKYITPH